MFLCHKLFIIIMHSQLWHFFYPEFIQLLLLPLFFNAAAETKKNSVFLLFPQRQSAEFLWTIHSLWPRSSGKTDNWKWLSPSRQFTWHAMGMHARANNLVAWKTRFHINSLFFHKHFFPLRCCFVGLRGHSIQYSSWPPHLTQFHAYLYAGMDGRTVLV